MQDNEMLPERENTTKYGEFVCSFHQWLPIEIQKKQIEKMSRITDKNHSNNFENK